MSATGRASKYGATLCRQSPGNSSSGTMPRTSAACMIGGFGVSLFMVAASVRQINYKLYSCLLGYRRSLGPGCCRGQYRTTRPCRFSWDNWADAARARTTGARSESGPGSRPMLGRTYRDQTFDDCRRTRVSGLRRLVRCMSTPDCCSGFHCAQSMGEASNPPSIG